MKIHKGLAVFVVKEKVLARELEVLASNENISLVRLSDDVLAAEPKAGERLTEVLRKRGYFPRPLFKNNSSKAE